MEVPVKNLVETVDLTSEDVLLPLLECVVNSIISLQQSALPKSQQKIQIQVERGDLSQALNFDNVKTIASFKVIDNGVGFNKRNFESFETPFSQVNKDHGCKGIGRFTILAAYQEFLVDSNYNENGQWWNRTFKFTTDKEIESQTFAESDQSKWRTTVYIKNCYNELVRERSALTVEQIAEAIMQHCFIYYLSGNLPVIELIDMEDKSGAVINDLFEKVSREKEREFPLNGHKFKIYITKTPKTGNRRNNYLYYCANDRSVGNPRNLKNINSIFTFPILVDSSYYFFDIYLVSKFLDSKVYKARNGFNIPKEKENLLFKSSDIVSFQDIEEEVSKLLEKEYDSFVKGAKDKSVQQIATYIQTKAPRYNSFIKNPEILQSIPPNLPEDKLEEHLYRISYNARKNVEKNIQKFIDDKSINEEAISNIINDIKEKTAYDVDSLADYMTRRKAILELFDKFLDADESGNYKLEQDVHKLVFPLGLTNNELDYENHNLWLLDERFITYKFIASDKAITSYSQKKSRKELDLILLDEPPMFDNPISFGDRSGGEVNSMVVFEFKRPGDTAHQKNKKDYRWQFSELVEPYFDEFLYQPNKKNYKGNQVVIHKTTPKFGFVILDVIPTQLASYNEDKGWKKTPFGTYFKIEPEINLHIEVMTFRKLLDFSVTRHNPFFDKLFVR
ncbi:hypothetical protein [Chitinophaga barathri]|uniref:ATP-binding protein n=1 Tax=Chitinophaga barathri TaxID=1647451 RepID=A0A3N4M9Q2_9BACT|nr:hypothetical protein [Chitinophaga barathri]RPD40065.1 hypothetical protein EG028_15520 [Chitinophaga barathri]